MKKLVLLLFAVSLFATSVVAGGTVSWDSDGALYFPNVQAPYDEVQTIKPYCDNDEMEANGGFCPTTSTNVEIKVCNSGWVEPMINPDGNGNTVYEFSFAPNAILPSCEIGNTTNFVSIRDDNGEWTGGWILHYPQVQANYLHVGFNGEKLKQFRLISDSSDADYDKGDPSDDEPGDVLVTEHNPNLIGDGDTWTRNYAADTGKVLERSTSTVLADIMANSCDSSDDTCNIAENFDYHDDYDTSECTGECGIGYERGLVEYYGNSEIIMGQAYGDGGPPSSLSYKKFYLCHDDLPGTHDTAVYSPDSSNEYDQFQCMATGDWIEVATCNDEIDNNENGATDIDDPSCDSTDESELDGANQCDNPAPQVAELEFRDPVLPTQYEKGVLYGADPAGDWHVNGSVSGTKCKYNYFDADVTYTDRSTHQFTCYDSVSENQEAFGMTSQYYDPPQSTEQRYNYCNSLTEAWPDNHPDNISAVEYYVPESAIPEGRNRYARWYGYKNKFFENLHDAEQRLAPSCTDVYSENRCWNLFLNGGTHYHDDNTWEHIGNITDLDDGRTVDGITYDGYNYLTESDDKHDYTDSWVVANGTGSGTPKVQQVDGTTDEDRVFRGGFAPKCDPGKQWKYDRTDGEWTCTGAVSWEQEVFIPGYRSGGGIQPANVTIGSSKTTVGMFIMPYVFKGDNIAPTSSLTSYKQMKASAEGENEANIQTVKALCWKGGVGDKSSIDFSDSSNVNKTWFANTISGISTDRNDPVPIFGKLEIDNPSAFTCSWGFQPDDGGEFDQNLGTPSFLSGSVFTQRFDERGYTAPEGENGGAFEQTEISSGKFQKFAEHWKDKGGSYSWPTSAPSELS